MQTLDIIKVIVSVLSLLATVGLFAWAKKRFEHYRKNRDTARSMQTEILGRVIEDLKVIKHQVLPNGGSSLNDKVSDIASHLGEIDKTLVAMKLRQRNSSEILDVANWESDKDGRVEYVSTALCDLVGRTSASLMDFRWQAYIHPEDRDRITKEWSESIKSGGEFNSFYRYIKADGAVQKVRGKAIHNTDENGNVMNSLGRLIKVE